MSNNNKDNKKNYYLSIGIGYGLLGGALSAIIIGIFVETPLVWAFAPGLGMLIGIIIGAIMDENKNKK